MIIDKLFSNATFTMLKKGIQGTNLRHEAITNNLANVDTPNYQRATVSFEKELKRAQLGVGFTGLTSDPAHFQIGSPMVLEMVQPKIAIDNNTRFRADRNNINIDAENAALAKNTMNNLAFTDLLSRRYKSLSKVISEAGAAR